MSIEQQIDALIQDAPNDGEMRQLLKTVGPVLQRFAGQLRHLSYYIAQTSDADRDNLAWVKVTLTHRTQSNVEKTVIYGFSDPKDVTARVLGHDIPHLGSVEIPVIDLLFQVWALNLCDSMIFFEMPGNCQNGTEISRSAIDAAIQRQLHPPTGYA
ncbi:hypothetical protein ACN4EG_13550 [Alkalinema pantanalense CENA528]|uniref:hypothetical protein n=1 Tax=Alkalinema pantanalense TaxID=1620705 RepID=UPI003D70071A